MKTRVVVCAAAMLLCACAPMPPLPEPPPPPPPAPPSADELFESLAARYLREFPDGYAAAEARELSGQR